MNRRDRDDKCALCDEFSRRGPGPEALERGMGVCKVRVDNGRYPSVLVPWNGDVCISYRLDRPNLAARRQFIATQQQKESPP